MFSHDHRHLWSQCFDYFKLRPCERQNFPNFSFSRVSELFGYQSWEIFQKNPVFLNSRKKFGNKFGSNTLFFGLKILFLSQKQGFWGQTQEFPNIQNLQNVWNLFYSEFSKNYIKWCQNWIFIFAKNSNSDLNIRVQVQYAGPYLKSKFKTWWSKDYEMIILWISLTIGIGVPNLHRFLSGLWLKVSHRMIFHVLRLEAVFEPQAKSLGA